MYVCVCVCACACACAWARARARACACACACACVHMDTYIWVRSQNDDKYFSPCVYCRCKSGSSNVA